MLKTLLTPDFKEPWHLRKPVFYEADLKSNGKGIKKNLSEELKKTPLHHLSSSVIHIQQNKLETKKELL